jgi:NAD-dependent deacetylase
MAAENPNNALPHNKIPSDLVNLLRSAQSVTILTGAGISAESGIPTFRDSQTGMWAKYNPQELATPQAFEQNPDLVLDWYRWRRHLVAQSQPNPGHLALTILEQHIPNVTLITQNVDGLHFRAGSRNILELHGSLQRMRCSDTSCGFTLPDWPDEVRPHCPQCGALLRPDVVWFGEMLDPRVLDQALRASRSCQVFFSIGTSGVVEPAASLPYEALRAGATVVEINPQPTPLNIYAKYSFPYPAGVALPVITEAVLGKA